jgi:hypothetical protein
MKKTCCVQFLILLTAFVVYSQGTFIYDQSSATNPGAGDGYNAFQISQLTEQSLTPTLSSVGFVQLDFRDDTLNGVGGTVFLNLFSGPIGSQTLLSSTDPIYIPPNVSDFVTSFIFSAPVAVTPGTAYYFQPYLQSGDSYLWVNFGDFNYSGGTFYVNGKPQPLGADMWFREGVIEVPEPSPAMMIFLGSGCFLYAWHKHKNQSAKKDE